MLTFTESHPRARINRRQALSMTSAAMLGSGMLSAKDSEVQFPGFGKAKSVLTIFAHGGQSQIDMWDPKPNAPEHVRGVFKPIQTALPGVHLPRICPVLPR